MQKEKDHSRWLQLTLQVGDRFCLEEAISSLPLQLVLQLPQLLLQLHPVTLQLVALFLHLPQADLQTLNVFLRLRLTFLQPRCRLLLGLERRVGLLELRVRCAVRIREASWENDEPMEQ